MNSIEHSEGQDTWRLVATGTTTPIEDNTPKIINVCNCLELGYWCAEYITGEMKKNPFTPEAQKIRRHLEKSTFTSTYNRLSWWKKALYAAFPKTGYLSTSGKHYSYACYLWYEQVSYKKPWDHKVYLGQELKRITIEKNIKIYKDSWAWNKINGHDYYFDIWSNIHYGYVGYLVGFSEDALRRGAALAQARNDIFSKKHYIQYHKENEDIIASMDDVNDQISINIGIELAKTKPPEELQLFDLLFKIESIPVPWGGTNENDSKSKRVHECQPKN
ncbi:polymorphic toxin type 44 domain-containing protein [Zymobacter sp. IVIA_12111.31 C1]|uniref:polymorphic toxin type 44 domain-containing protein n=1 Tax=Zymobacter sp. IVIA_12111.31 C1 TaxID=3394854 RepID=UPI0039C437B2